jgi:hypothetical protein
VRARGASEAGIGGIMLAGAAVPFIRYLILLGLANGSVGQHLQSLLLGVALLIGALLSFALGAIAELQKTNRILAEHGIENSKMLLYGQADLFGAPQLPQPEAFVTEPLSTIRTQLEPSKGVVQH